MDLRINKDFSKEYPSDVWKGFSLTQLIYIVVSTVSGACVIALFYFVLGFNIHIAVYGAFPIAAPIAIAGFYQHAGMNLVEFIKNWRRLENSMEFPYMADERREWKEIGQDI